MYLCRCGYKSKSISAFQKHVKRPGHGNVESDLGHLIIRNDPNDKEEILRLEQKLKAAGLR